MQNKSSESYENKEMKINNYHIIDYSKENSTKAL